MGKTFSNNGGVGGGAGGTMKLLAPVSIEHLVDTTARVEHQILTDYQGQTHNSGWSGVPLLYTQMMRDTLGFDGVTPQFACFKIPASYTRSYQGGQIKITLLGFSRGAAANALFNVRLGAPGIGSISDVIATPRMAYDGKPSFAVVTASSLQSSVTPAIGALRPCAMGYAPNSNFYWASAGSGVLPQWLQVQLPSARKVFAYSFRQPDPDIAAPQSWTLKEGDGASFNDLDTRTGITWGTGQRKWFYCANPAAGATHHRLHITAYKSGANYAALGELTLYHNVFDAPRSMLIGASGPVGGLTSATLMFTPSATEIAAGQPLYVWLDRLPLDDADTMADEFGFQSMILEEV